MGLESTKNLVLGLNRKDFCRGVLRFFSTYSKGRSTTSKFRVKWLPLAIFGEMGELLGDGFGGGVGGCFVKLGAKPG